MAQQDRMFDIPGFTYFSSGNDYTGGCHGFRYKLYLKDDLHAAWWEDDLCFEKCTIREEETLDVYKRQHPPRSRSPYMR